MPGFQNQQPSYGPAEGGGGGSDFVPAGGSPAPMGGGQPATRADTSQVPAESPWEEWGFPTIPQEMTDKIWADNNKGYSIRGTLKRMWDNGDYANNTPLRMAIYNGAFGRDYRQPLNVGPDQYSMEMRIAMVNPGIREKVTKLQDLGREVWFQGFPSSGPGISIDIRHLGMPASNVDPRNLPPRSPLIDPDASEFSKMWGIASARGAKPYGAANFLSGIQTLRGDVSVGGSQAGRSKRLYANELDTDFDAQLLSEWLESPKGQQRLLNQAVLGLPLTDDEYKIAYSGSDPEKSRAATLAERAFWEDKLQPGAYLKFAQEAGWITQEQVNRYTPTIIDNKAKVRADAFADLNVIRNIFAQIDNDIAKDFPLEEPTNEDLADDEKIIDKLFPDVNLPIGTPEWMRNVVRVLNVSPGVLGARNLTILGETIFGNAGAAATSDMWINRLPDNDPYKKAFEEALRLSPPRNLLGATDTDYDALATALRVVSKDPELAGYLLSNMKSKYEENVKGWERLIMESALSLPLFLIGAKGAVTPAMKQALVEVINATKNVGALKNAARFGTMYDASQLRQAEAAIKTAESAFLKAAGTKNIQSATERTMADLGKEYARAQIKLNKLARLDRKARADWKGAADQYKTNPKLEKLTKAATDKAARAYGNWELVALKGVLPSSKKIVGATSGVDGLQTLYKPDQLVATMEISGKSGNALKLEQARRMIVLQVAQGNSLAALKTQTMFENGLILAIDDVATKVTNVTGGAGDFALHPLVVLENPRSYTFTDASLAKMYKTVYDHPQIKQIYDVLQKRLELLKYHGIDFKLFEMGNMKEWLGRIVKQVEKGTGGGRVKKIAFLEQRKWAAIEDGIAAGVNYETNIPKLIEGLLSSTYETIARNNAVQWLKPLGKELAKLPKKPTLESGFVKNVRGLEQFQFSPKDAEVIDKMFRTKKLNPILNAALKPMQIARFGVTGIDFSAPYIQGSQLMVNSPEIWGGAYAKSWQSVFSKNFPKQFATDHQESIRTMITRGEMILGSAEMMEGAGVLSKIPKVGPFLETLAQPFERAYNTFLDTARVLLWEARYNPAMTDMQAKTLGNFSDKLLGVNPGAIYQSVTAKAIQTLALFAPRYYTAKLALYRDIFYGGLKGTQAAIAIAKTEAGMHAVYAGATLALGEKPQLDPSKPHYLETKIGNGWYGMPGWDSTFTRMIGRTILNGIENPEGIPQIMVQELAWFSRSKLSLGLRPFVDTAIGTSYDGHSVTSLEGFTKYEVLGSFTPISLMNVLAGFPKEKWYMNGDAWQMAALDFMGGKSRAVSEYDRYQEVLDKATARSYPGLTYSELKEKNPMAAQAISGLPASKEAKRIADEERVAKGSGWFEAAVPIIGGMGKHQLGYMKENMASIDEFNKAVTEATDRMVLPMSDPKSVTVWEGRELIKIAEQKRGQDNEKFRVTYPAYFEEMAGWVRTAKPETKDAMAYYDYIDNILHHPSYIKDGLEWQDRAEIKNNLEKEFITKWGQDTYGRVLLGFTLGKGLPDVYTEYKMMQDEIEKSGLWNVKYPENQQIDRDKADMFLRQNSRIDALGYTWGYWGKVQTQDAADMVENFIRDLDFPRSIPTAVIPQETQNQIDKLDSQIRMAATAATSKRPFDVNIEELENAYYTTSRQIYAFDKLIRTTQAYDKQKQYIESRDNAIEVLKRYIQLLSAFDQTHPKVRVIALKLQRDILKKTLPMK